VIAITIRRSAAHNNNRCFRATKTSITKVTPDVNRITACHAPGVLNGIEALPMYSWKQALLRAVVISGTALSTLAAPTVVFPNASELRSPDGRFVVRNAEREAPSADFVGTFHSLWLIDTATGQSHKICDYVGVVAVRWSDNEHLLMTEYVARKSSRALLFSLLPSEDSVMLDKAAVIALVPPQSRTILRENDHVFVEAIGIQQGILALTVWGNGQHDRRGFRWQCNYDLRERSLACTEEPIPH
jgi:hypothetical protein